MPERVTEFTRDAPSHLALVLLPESSKTVQGTMFKTILFALATLSIAATAASQDSQKDRSFVPRPAPQKIAPPWLGSGPPLAAKAPQELPAAPAPRPAARTTTPAGFDPTRVLFDDLGDRGLWAATGAYKVRFDPTGVTYVPFLGSTAPHNWPVTFRLDRVTVAGEDLAISEAAEVLRARDAVTLRRGKTLEHWLLRATEVEQTFEITALPARGELVVEVAVDTALEGRRLGDGFEFRGPDGGVRYGAAVAIDAVGRRIALESELSGGRIVHRVPAGFVQQAVLPIVVDPVISTFAGTPGAYAFGRPDTAFEAGSGLFMVVSERRYSASDTDVWSELRDQQGQLVPGSGVWIDVSTDDLRKPRVAATRATSKFLIVAEGRTVNTSGTDIRGRVRDATGTFSMLTPITISTSANDAKNPDVGGNGHPTGPDYWTVVWGHVHTATDTDIHYRLVRDDGTFTTPSSIVLENSSANEIAPRISKSCGRSNAPTQSAMVVFVREISPSVQIVCAAILSWNGTILQPTFPVTPSGWALRVFNPSVSSPTEVIGGRRYHLITSQVSVTSADHDIYADLVASDGQIVASMNLTALSLELDVTPTVDCDGYRFGVSYSHAYDVNTNDYDVYATTVHARFPPNAWLGFTERPIGVATGPQWEGAPAIAARHDGGDGGYLIALEDSNGTQPSIVRGAVYEGLGAGGLTRLPHGCHGFPITATGEPLIGHRISFQVPGPTSGLSTSGTLFGFVRTPSIPLPMCAVPCTLGVDGQSYGPLIRIDIPITGALVGAQVAVQGWDLLGGSCFGAGLRLSDTYVMTVR